MRPRPGSSPRVRRTRSSPGTSSTGTSPVCLVTTNEASQVSYAWAGRLLNVSASVGGLVAFASANADEAQTLQATWTGPITGMQVTTFSPNTIAFDLQSGSTIAFQGSGFAPSTSYTLTQGGATVLTAQSSASGGLSFVTPAAGGGSYALSNGQGSSIVFPFPAIAAPLIFPAIALVLLAVSFVLVRFMRRRQWDNEGSAEEDREGDSGRVSSLFAALGRENGDAPAPEEDDPRCDEPPDSERDHDALVVRMRRVEQIVEGEEVGVVQPDQECCARTPEECDGPAARVSARGVALRATG